MQYEEEEENWDEQAACNLPSQCLESAYDWLEADDPALFSDEFSEPDEWNNDF